MGSVLCPSPHHALLLKVSCHYQLLDSLNLSSQSNVSLRPPSGTAGKSRLQDKGLTPQRPISFIYTTYLALRESELEICESAQIPPQPPRAAQGGTGHSLHTYPFMQPRSRAESSSQTPPKSAPLEVLKFPEPGALTSMADSPGTQLSQCASAPSGGHKAALQATVKIFNLFPSGPRRQPPWAQSIPPTPLHGCQAFKFHLLPSQNHPSAPLPGTGLSPQPGWTPPRQWPLQGRVQPLHSSHPCASPQVCPTTALWSLQGKTPTEAEEANPSLQGEQQGPGGALRERGSTYPRRRRPR